MEIIRDGKKLKIIDANLSICTGKQFDENGDIAKRRKEQNNEFS